MSYIRDTDLPEKLRKKVSAMKAWQGGQVPCGTSVSYFDWMEFLVKGFWTYIVELAQLSGDSTVYFYDLERSETRGFVPKFSLYPIVKLDASMTEAEYIAALHEEPVNNPGVSFAVSNTDAYIIFPASGEWYVHGEYSIEMAELVSFVGLPSQELFPHDFFDEKEAFRRIQSRINVINDDVGQIG